MRTFSKASTAATALERQTQLNDNKLNTQCIFLVEQSGWLWAWPMVTILRRRWQVSGTIRTQLPLHGASRCLSLPRHVCSPLFTPPPQKFMATFNCQVYVTASELNLHKTRNSPFCVLRSTFSDRRLRFSLLGSLFVVVVVFGQQAIFSRILLVQAFESLIVSV